MFVNISLYLVFLHRRVLIVFPSLWKLLNTLSTDYNLYLTTKERKLKRPNSKIYQQNIQLIFESLVKSCSNYCN